ncbi:MAG TPA: MATE family efflux transporter [Candidatus Paceibacterota bacterium]|nr:MATE family efflux transporter [Verrucomicrobiota bacterium]HRY47043.1 MATE family efflux transporter [Candidatus Paceibacterota bacterium]
MTLAKAIEVRRWTREIKPIARLAVPIMAGMISQMLIGLADTVMVGRVGVVPLAAASFVNTLAHLPFIFSLGLLSSIAVLTAQVFGARKPVETGEVLRHGLVISTMVGIGASAGVAIMHPLLSRFGQPPEVVAAAGKYLLLFAASLAPALISHGCRQFSEAVNRPWIPNLILLGGVLLNVLLNWILIFGHWGLPAMGLEGAGWATLITRLIQAGCFLGYLFYTPVMRSFHPASWKAPCQRLWFRRLLTIGWPVGAQHLLEIGAFSLAALMMGWIHAEAMAAHQIAMTCAATSFMFALGIGMASCIRVGQAHGAGRHHRKHRIGLLSIMMAASVMGMFGILFISAGTPIARLFVKEPSVIALAAHLLFLAALFQVADGTQVAALSALRGLNDVRIPVLVAGLAYWLLALPTGYLLAFPCQLGAAGIWIGLAVGLGTTALGLSWRFHRLTSIHQN